MRPFWLAGSGGIAHSLRLGPDALSSANHYFVRCACGTRVVLAAASGEEFRQSWCGPWCRTERGQGPSAWNEGKRDGDHAHCVLFGHRDGQHPGRSSAAGDRSQPYAIASLPELFRRHDARRRFLSHDARSGQGGIGRDDSLGSDRSLDTVLPRTILLVSPPRAARARAGCPSRGTRRGERSARDERRFRKSRQRIGAPTGRLDGISRLAVGFGRLWSCGPFAGGGRRPGERRRG